MCLLTSPILSFPSSAFLPSAPCVMLSSTLPVNHQWMAVLNVSESAAEDNRYQNRTTILHNQCVAKQSLHAVNMMNHGVQCFNFAIFVYYIHTPFMTHADNVHVTSHQFTSLLPRPLPDFISQPWRKTYFSPQL